MLVFVNKSKKLVLGRGLVGYGIADWLSTAVNFLSANKDTISNVASVVGNLAKSTAETVGAAKDIYNVIKKRKEGKGTGINKVLTLKSQQILKRLAEK